MSKPYYPGKPGPKPGTKQSASHIEKKKRFGAQHHARKGDDVSKEVGHARARALVPDLGDCEDCGKPAMDRHHIDDNPANNSPGNIAILCRRCHMVRDGRLEKMGKIVKVPKGTKLSFERRKQLSEKALARYRAAEAAGLKPPVRNQQRSRLHAVPL